MLVRCIRPAKVAGLRMKPGEVADVPEWMARELRACEPPAIAPVSGRRETNLESGARATNVSSADAPWTFVKCSEGEE